MTASSDHEDEEIELDRFLARQRPVTDEQGDVLVVREAIRAARDHGSGNDLRGATLEFEKWRAIHRYVHARPFRLPGGLKRSQEWRQVAKRFAPLGCEELMQWIGLQVEVAASREEGRYDQRVRRDGPCFLIVLEYVANRKRTALAILHWAREDAGDSA